MTQLDAILNTDNVMDSDNNGCGAPADLDDFLDTIVLIASQGSAMADNLGDSLNNTGALTSFSAYGECDDCLANECGTVAGCQDTIYSHTPDYTLVDVSHLDWIYNGNCSYGFHCTAGQAGGPYNCSDIICGDICTGQGCSWDGSACSGEAGPFQCYLIGDSATCDCIAPTVCGGWQEVLDPFTAEVYFDLGNWSLKTPLCGSLLGDLTYDYKYKNHGNCPYGDYGGGSSVQDV